jgi:hypothetical protein
MKQGLSLYPSLKFERMGLLDELDHIEIFIIMKESIWHKEVVVIAELAP